MDDNIAALISKMRKETTWGCTKIVDSLRNMGYKASRQTVKNVLKETGLFSDPVDHSDTWSGFLKRHAHVMWQCDFACKRKWTIKGMVDLYFLVFIHIETRQIWVSPCTASPTGDWTTQQATELRHARVVHTINREILNGFCIVNERQLDHILTKGTVLETRSINALGKVRRQWTNAAGRTLRSFDELDEATVFTYDASGNQLSVRDPNNVGASPFC